MSAKPLPEFGKAIVGSFNGAFSDLPSCTCPAQRFRGAKPHDPLAVPLRRAPFGVLASDHVEGCPIREMLGEGGSL